MESNEMLLSNQVSLFEPTRRAPRRMVADTQMLIIAEAEKSNHASEPQLFLQMTSESADTQSLCNIVLDNTQKKLPLLGRKHA